MKKTNPAPCNLHPLKFDFYMIEPKLIFHAEIDIEKKSVIIKYWDFQNPKIEKMPIGNLKETEIIDVFKDELASGMGINEIKDFS